MTDRYERIRKALAMEPTPGDWDADFASAMRNGSPAVVEYFVRRDGDDISIAADIVNPSSGLPSAVNANYIAACDPDTIRALLAERDQLAAENARLRDALECLLIGACAVGVPHAGERAVLQDAVNIARAALAKAAGQKGGEA